jgi:dihydropteroate synthase
MYTLNCNGRLLAVTQPVVMGIINLTTDSFYAESRNLQTAGAVATAKEMIAQGATLLDLGAQSTRPGAERLTAATEISRLLPVVQAIREALPEAYLSIDTFYAETARACVENGADLVNDITGGHFDQEMLPAVAGLKVPFCCMHMKGMPDTMQELAVYTDVTREVMDYCIERIGACTQAGIHDLILDPGFGFAKTIRQNLELLNKMETLQLLGKPLLAGLSRKSTVYKTLGITAAEALNGTTVLNTIALQKGAGILRVHDVKEAMEAIRLVQALAEADRQPV